jgi:hypothetical protein
MNIINIIKEEINDFVDEFDVSTLPNITLKSDAPQLSRVGKFPTNVTADSVEVLDNRFEPNILYDFVVDMDGNLTIGGGHYKLSKKAPNIKAAGEIKINDQGKIIYLNNESGHYEPSHQNVQDIYNLFREMNLTTPETQIEKRHE